jgi:4-hydroxy-2-oxoheptanedioate aldolase
MTYKLAGVVPGGPGRLRELVTDRRVAYGGWCMVPSAFATEVISAAGCDWICIDLQHGLVGEETMRLMVQAAAIRDTPVLVRVPWNEPGSIMRALDAGAEGVIVPMVNTADDSLRAAAATLYPPLGIRSWGPIRSTMAQPGFNPSVGNEQSVCLVMIETVEAFANLESILDVPGIHGVFVGPNDLAISHSGSGEGAGRAPRDVAMIEEIAQACAARGLVAGTACTAEDAPRWIQMGYTFLGLQSDAALLARAMADELAAARAA